MLRIALGLGLAYVGFLACWIWVTRLDRGRRAIDTGRRIDYYRR